MMLSVLTTRLMTHAAGLAAGGVGILYFMSVGTVLDAGIRQIKKREKKRKKKKGAK